MKQSDFDAFVAISTLKEITSTNEKMSFLSEKLKESCGDNIVVLLKLAFEPTQKYEFIIKEVPEYEDFEIEPSIIDFAEYVNAKKPFRNNESRELLLKEISKFPTELIRGILVSVINKDLVIGMGISSVNKVFKENAVEQILELKPMKAAKEKDIDIAEFLDSLDEGEFVFVQNKIDAARAFLVYDSQSDDCYFLSANGNRIDCMSHITTPTKLFGREMYSFIMDGELIARNPDGSYQKRSKSNGLFNKAVKGTLTETDATVFEFVAWDFLEGPYYRDYKKEEEGEIPIIEILYRGEGIAQERCRVPYSSRIVNLEWAVARMKSDETFLYPCSITVVPYVEFIEGNPNLTKAAIYGIAEKQFAKGEEGVILKRDHMYQPKRINELVKIKKAYMADVRVTGINEGKNRGTLGSLNYATDDGLIAGDVSGIPNDLKALWWDDPSLIVGRVIEVRYMEVSFDKRTNKKTLYGPPVYIRERTDKMETSTLKELE